MPKLVEALGKNLLRLRKEKKLSQEALGDLIGVTRQTILSYEKGEGHISEATIAKLAVALNVEETELTSGPKLTADDYKAFYELAVTVDKLKKENEALTVIVKSHPPPYEPNILTATPSDVSKPEYLDPQIQELISLFTTLDESQKTSAIGFIKSLGWASVSATQDKQKKSK
jgi:transcriptional regulator with XRE-family HTH domain